MENEIPASEQLIIAHYGDYNLSELEEEAERLEKNIANAQLRVSVIRKMIGALRNAIASIPTQEAEPNQELAEMVQEQSTVQPEPAVQKER